MYVSFLILQLILKQVHENALRLQQTDDSRLKDTAMTSANTHEVIITHYTEEQNTRSTRKFICIIYEGLFSSEL